MSTESQLVKFIAVWWRSTPPPYSLDLMAATGFQIYRAMSRNFWFAHPMSAMLSSRELRGTQILYKTLVPPVS